MLSAQEVVCSWITRLPVPLPLNTVVTPLGQGCLFLILGHFCLLVFKTHRQLTKSIPLSDPNLFQCLNGNFHLLNQNFHFITRPLINAPGRKQNKEMARKPRNNFLPLSSPVQLCKLSVAEQTQSRDRRSPLIFPR